MRVNLRKHLWGFSFGIVCMLVVQSFRLFTCSQSVSNIHLNDYAVPVHLTTAALSVPLSVAPVPPTKTKAFSLSKKNFVVWMFPFPPQNSQDMLLQADETLICPYSNACPQHHQDPAYTQINLRSLTEDTFFENYVRDHAWHKIRHWQDFPCHIQVITSMTLLRNNPGSCVRTMGSSQRICNPNAYAAYDPYDDYSTFPASQPNFPIENTTSRPSFPIELVQEQGESLVPNMSAERFAIYGVYPFEEKGHVAGYYNSGNDVQWLASAHWLPFISDIRHWKDALLDNYTGYLIGNALSNLFAAPPDLDMQMMRKFSLLSVFTEMKLVESKDNFDFYQRYTNEIEAFGSRSSLTHRQLLDRKIKAYFSACLTLTTNLQGAILSNPNGYAPALNAQEITKPTLGKNNEIHSHNGIFMVDVAVERIIPRDIRKRAKRLYANIPRSFPLDPHSYRARMGYAYRLVSQYAQEAKVIITSRIHVGLPALALGVPIIFIKSSTGKLPGGNARTGRVAGLIEFFHLIDLSKGDKWTFGNLTAQFVVPPNPGNDAVDRHRASFWNRFKRTSHYYKDTAKLFGMVPFQRLGRANPRLAGLQDTFHFLLEAKDMMHWQTKRAIELVFYYHPNARVYVHSNDLSADSALETFVDSGYDLVVHPHDVASLARNGGRLTLPRGELEISSQAVNHVLNKYGGVFLSKNTFLRKKIPMSIDSGVIMGGSSKTHHVVMMILGNSTGIDEVSKNPSWKLHNLSKEDTRRCLDDALWQFEVSPDNALAVILDQSTFLSMNSVRLDTKCYSLLEAACIYCDEVHVTF